MTDEVTSCRMCLEVDGTCDTHARILALEVAKKRIAELEAGKGAGYLQLRADRDSAEAAARALAAELEAAEARAAMLREALGWAKKAFEAAHEEGLLGGAPDEPAQAEYERNLAPILAALASAPSDWLRKHERALLSRAFDLAWSALYEQPRGSGHKEDLRVRFVNQVLGG